MVRSLLMLAIVIVALVATGCVTHSGGVAAATRPLGDPSKYAVTGRTVGTSWGITLFGIPLSQADTEDALNDAKGGADALIEVAVTNRDYFLGVLMLQRIRVAGYTVRVKN